MCYASKAIHVHFLFFNWKEKYLIKNATIADVNSCTCVCNAQFMWELFWYCTCTSVSGPPRLEDHFFCNQGWSPNRDSTVCAVTRDFGYCGVSTLVWNLSKNSLIRSCTPLTFHFVWCTLFYQKLCLQVVESNKYVIAPRNVTGGMIRKRHVSKFCVWRHAGDLL